MTWTPTTIRALRSHLGLNQQDYGERLGYGEAGARVRVSELENGKQDPSGPLVPLLDCIAREHSFKVDAS